MKILWLLSGANGAGKSTYYRLFLELKKLPFVNADEIAKKKFPGGTAEEAKKAQFEAHEIYIKTLNSGINFCYETVFSHPLKLDFIKLAQAHGYFVNLVYIHLDDPELNIARVIQRVGEGGHDVPDDKIKSRIPRTMDYVSEAVILANKAIVYDNSSTTDRYKEMAFLVSGLIKTSVTPKPDWLLTILKRALAMRFRKRHTRSQLFLQKAATSNDLKRLNLPVILIRRCDTCGSILKRLLEKARGTCVNCGPLRGRLLR